MSRRDQLIASAAAALLLGAPSAAMAQAAPVPANPAAPPAAPAGNAQPTSVSSVVVTGVRPVTKASIDRRVYNVTRDLQATTGSVDDVLRNVPSVDVDLQGNVSVRGDTNVQILIDGKPSTMMTAANRGAVLQQMPADTIESIEVMTNPSARYKPDGASGLINIITKKNRKAGRSGTVQATVGSEGRSNLGFTEAVSVGRYKVSGSASMRRDKQRRQSTSERTRISSTGVATKSEQQTLTESRRHSEIVALGVDFDATAHDRLSAAINYNQRSGSPQINEHDIATGASGAVTSDFTRIGDGTEREVSSEASATYVHSFADDDHQFSVDLRRGETREHQQRVYANAYAVPASPTVFDELRPKARELEEEFTAEYEAPLPGEVKVMAGYDLQHDVDDYDNYGGRVDPALDVHTPDPAQTNRFIYAQSIHALYGTYQRPFGKWTVLGGLRLEEALVDTNQVTSALVGSNNYFHAYPSLHLQYDLSDSKNLRLSYSHRVSRPEADDLNPYPIYQDPFNLRAGNPQLKPQETHSLEAGYQYNGEGTSLLATVYLRKTYNAFTTVSRSISPTVLLTTEENLGKSTSGGVELAGSGELTSAITYNVSGNVFYNQVDASNLGLTTRRSALSYQTKGSFDAHLGPKDLVQVSVNYSGKRLTAQGYRLPSSTLNFGYRHEINDSLAAVFTVADVFRSQRDRSVIDTATLQDTSTRRQLGRTVNLGLNWKFGGARKSDEQFDFSTQ